MTENKSKYCLQLPNGIWTEWRDIDVPVKEPHILTFRLTEYVTKEQYQEFIKQISNV